MRQPGNSYFAILWHRQGLRPGGLWNRYRSL
nr:MAG TPA: hypothetical protein [Caudoviricetes sp.]